MNRVDRPALHRHAHRLVRWQRLSLYITGVLLLVTGGVWLLLHHGPGAGELPHPLEAWCLRVHGLAAFAGLFVLGALAAAHIPQGWRLSQRRRWAGQRRSGALLCAIGALLVVSGYLLYYFAPEALRPALGWAHAAAGVAMGGLLLSHRRGA
jgi:peptidoglycan/LPS O-acetylase OafA/YrhL